MPTGEFGVDIWFALLFSSLLFVSLKCLLCSSLLLYCLSLLFPLSSHLIPSLLTSHFSSSPLPSSPLSPPRHSIVNVSAADNATGKTQNIVIQSSGGLSDAEIERMIQEAEARKGDDEKRKEAIEARNAADSLVYETRKTFDEHKEKLSADDQAEVEAALEDVQKTLEDENAEGAEIKDKTDALAKAAQKIGSAMYGQQEGGEGDAAGAEEEKKDEENVVDAEYEEKEKKQG